MTFCLNTKIIKPEENEEIKNAVILLHGYGGDGKDISMITLNWKRFLKNTIFLCPDAHEVCKINPTGFQWFDLTNEDREKILIESKKGENKLKQYIDEIKLEYKLKNFWSKSADTPISVLYSLLNVSISKYLACGFL